MRYSIGQVAKKLGLTAHTLRYYDKEGLLPFVRKGSSGARVFEDEDVDWLIIIECLKGTGMQLKIYGLVPAGRCNSWRTAGIV